MQNRATQKASISTTQIHKSAEAREPEKLKLCRRIKECRYGAQCYQYFVRNETIGTECQCKSTQTKCHTILTMAKSSFHVGRHANQSLNTVLITEQAEFTAHTLSNSISRPHVKQTSPSKNAIIVHCYKGIQFKLAESFITQNPCVTPSKQSLQ